MKNRKIVFANQKGGVGKSTLCILFANYLAWKKQQVCVIDTDLQCAGSGDHAAAYGFGFRDRRVCAFRFSGQCIGRRPGSLIHQCGFHSLPL